MPSALLLTAASAALYSAAFPPLSLAWLAWVALAPWLLALARVGPVRATTLGLLWGVAIGFGTGWSLVEMVAGYLGQPRWVGWATLLTVSAVTAGLPCAAFAACVSWLGRRGAGSPFVVGAVFALCELGRSHFLVGNPWATVATSQVESAVVQSAALIGPYGVALLIGAFNAALAALVQPALRGPHFAREGALVAAATLAASVYGQGVLHGALDGGAPLRVAIVQGAVERDLAWRPEHRRAGLTRHLELSAQAPPESADLLVWPESAVTFYLQEESAERAALLEAVRARGGTLLLGAPHYDAREGGRPRYHNSVYAIADGQLVARYDKQHLVPFAEERTLGFAADERATYSRGVKTAPLDAANTRLGTFVCFEAMYPDLVRQAVRAGAEVLVNVSNDAWFGSEAAARHHLQHAILRAIESRRYLVRATSTGYSAIVDPLGRVVTRSAYGTPDVLLGPVEPRRELTWYARLGDWPLLVSSAALLLVRLLGASQHRAMPR